MTRPTWGDRLRVVGVFLLVGPPAGLLPMLVAIAATSAADRSPTLDAGSFVTSLPLLLALAYFVGAGPALAAGLFAAATAGWAHRPAPYLAAVTAAGFVGTAVCSVALKPLPAADTTLRGALALGCVGAFAAACCAGLVVAVFKGPALGPEAASSFRRKPRASPGA